MVRREEVDLLHAVMIFIRPCVARTVLAEIEGVMMKFYVASYKKFLDITIPQNRELQIHTSITIATIYLTQRSFTLP